MAQHIETLKEALRISRISGVKVITEVHSLSFNSFHAVLQKSDFQDKVKTMMGHGHTMITDFDGEPTTWLFWSDSKELKVF